MKVTVKRVDKNLPLPELKTKGAVGFDLVAREEMTISSHEICLVPLNVVVKTPEGHALFIMSRSSTPMKKGLMVANSVGLIDQDYCGNDDELKLQVYNFTDKDVLVEKGERLAQAVFVKVTLPEFVEVEKMEEPSRGGFGTTG